MALRWEGAGLHHRKKKGRRPDQFHLRRKVQIAKISPEKQRIHEHLLPLLGPSHRQQRHVLKGSRFCLDENQSKGWLQDSHSQEHHIIHKIPYFHDRKHPQQDQLLGLNLHLGHSGVIHLKQRKIQQPDHLAHLRPQPQNDPRSRQELSQLDPQILPFLPLALQPAQVAAVPSLARIIPARAAEGRRRAAHCTGAAG